jgi:putative transcriptional regulator
MTEILQDKSLATKFQILVEVAAGQPDIQQKDIARKLNITPQWVSEYIVRLVEDGWVISEGRSKYRVTKEGMDWLLKMLREMQGYFTIVEQVARNITVCAAVADCNLSRGQTVGLVMRDGLLLATDFEEKGAKGIAVSDAREGEDVAVSDIEGIVELEMGKVTVLKVPDIQGGGFRGIDLARLGKEVSGEKIVGAIGIEALVALKQIGVTPQYFYGVKEAVIEAAQCGLSSVVVCVEDDIPDLLQRLREKHLEYGLLELGKVR